MFCTFFMTYKIINFIVLVCGRGVVIPPHPPPFLAATYKQETESDFSFTEKLILMVNYDILCEKNQASLLKIQMWTSMPKKKLLRRSFQFHKMPYLQQGQLLNARGVFPSQVLHSCSGNSKGHSFMSYLHGP